MQKVEKLLGAIPQTPLGDSTPQPLTPMVPSLDTISVPCARAHEAYAAPHSGVQLCIQGKP